MSGGRAIWDDGCFRIDEDDDGVLWVTEILHAHEGGMIKEDVPKRWRIQFEDLEAALRLIGKRLRESHNRMYHFHVERVGLAG